MSTTAQYVPRPADQNGNPAWQSYNLSLSPIHGGVTLSPLPGGPVFIVTLSSGTTPAKVMALHRNPAQSPTPLIWEYVLTHNCYASPAVSQDGSRLFLGTDGGQFLCLDTQASAAQRLLWSYTHAPGIAGSDRHIRSHPALDETRGLVYFHGNDGYLRAFNLTTGTPFAAYLTLNQQPLGFVVDGEEQHGDVNSSAPVIDASGNIYVGTSLGKLRGFRPTTDPLPFLVVPLTYPGQPTGTSLQVEAPPAIGPNGWIYVGTRQHMTTDGFLRARAFGIDPALTGGNPIRWSVEVPSAAGWGDVTFGVVVSPVLDRQGFVYFADFSHLLTRWNALNGEDESSLATSGKLCQAPTLLRDGTLLLGTSGNGFGYGLMGALTLEPSGDLVSGWTLPLPTPLGAGAGNLFGRIAVDSAGNGFLGAELLTSGGIRSGALYKFPGNLTNLMPSSWPTLQSGNRGDGRVNERDRYELIELTGFTPPQGYSPSTEVRGVEPWGRTAGYSQSYYGQTAIYWSPSQAASWPGGQLVTPSVVTSVHPLGMAVGYQGYSYPEPVLWRNLGTPAVTKTVLNTPTTGTYLSDMTHHRDGNVVIAGYGGGGRVIFWWESLGFQPQTMGWFPGGAGQVYGISHARRICGQARFTTTGPMVACYTDQGLGGGLPFLPQGLGTFGGNESAAWDIHDSGGVVGWARNGDNRTRAFRFPDPATLGNLNSAMHELPKLPGVSVTTYSSVAYGVNRQGHTVGYATIDSGAARAFLYRPELAGTPEVMIDLNSLPDVAGSGWTLTRANAIADSGLIVGAGTKAGTSGSRSWILIPKQLEP